ncbi:hypothetical protein DRP53_10525, partial [candidate division WOR-3 bacterium]
MLLTTLIYGQPGWTEDRRLSFASFRGWHPRVAAAGETVHVIWEAEFLGSSYDSLFYKRSSDAGETWQREYNIGPPDTGIIGPRLGCCDTIVFTIWGNDVFKKSNLRCRYSTNGGISWGDIMEIENAVGIEFQVSTDTIHIIGGKIDTALFTKSTDLGTSWSIPETLDTNSRTTNADIVAIDSFVYAIFETYPIPGPYEEIEFVRSTNYGLTWQRPQIISDIDTIPGIREDIAVDSLGNPHVCWIDYKYAGPGFTGDVFYRRSTDHGLTWEPIVKLTSVSKALNPSIAVEGTNVHVVWEDYRLGA